LVLDSLNLSKNGADVNAVVGRLTSVVPEFIAVTDGGLSDSFPLKELENNGLFGQIEIGVSKISLIKMKPGQINQGMIKTLPTFS